MLLQSYRPIILPLPHFRHALSALRRVIGAEWLFHAFVAIYLLIATMLAMLLGASERLVPFMYLSLWMIGLLQTVLIYVLLIQVPLAIRAGSDRPLTEAVNTTRAKFASRFIPGTMLIMSTAIFYGTFTSIKNLLPLITDFWFDWRLAEFDSALHGGRSPWKLLHPTISHLELTRVIEHLYGPVWILLLCGFATMMALHPKLSNLKTRYFTSMFVIFVFLGNVVAGVGMSAGPVYYDQVTGDADRFSQLIEYLSYNEGLLHSAFDIQKYLWDNHSAGRAELGTGISAFPSLHVAMATLFALAGWKVDARLGFSLWVYAGVILIGSVHLGWHYALDGYVSAVFAIAIWNLAGRLQPFLADRTKLAAVPGYRSEWSDLPGQVMSSRVNS